MDANDLNKKVSQRLIGYGFKGVISVNRAREIVERVKGEFIRSPSCKQFDISIELSPVHTVGKGIFCDCNRSTIRVQAKNVTARRRL